MSAITATETDCTDAVLSERVQLLYKQVPTALIGFLGSSLIAAAVFADRVTVTPLLIWLGCLLLVSAAIFLHYRDYQRSVHDNTAQRLRRLTRFMAALSTVAGMSGLVLFVSDSLSYQLILMVLLFAWAVGAAIAAAGHTPGFYVFLITLITPYCCRLLYEGGFLHIALAGAVLSFAMPVAWVHNNISGMIVKTLRLQFEHAELARNLQLQKNSAEQANRAKSRFLAAASHDLRQPLHALGLFVGELKARLSDAKSLAIIEKVNASASAMTMLFNALLDISKLDAGVIHPDVKPFPINTLFAEIELESYPQAEAKQLRFKVVPCRAVVRSDPTLLACVVRNLVSNAVRYTRAGGVVLGCRYRDDRLRIEVWDSGIGIEPGAHQAIFEEFVRLEAPQRDRGMGLGLGLSVAARIAALLGHRIALVSVPGRGSKFSIEVPLVRERSTIIFEGLSTPRVCELDLAGLNVLVIDDDRTVLDAMHGILTSWGCHAMLAASMDEAVASLARQAPSIDAIIADYRLANNESGVAAISKLRETCNAGIPAILITGDTAPSELRLLDAVDYPILHKPVGPDNLKQLLGAITRAPDDRLAD